mgnify:FL=1
MNAPNQIPYRILVTKVGLDGHDRGSRIVAAYLRDAGMEVIYTGIRQSPQMITQAAAQEDVDVIGMSILSGAHLEILPEIMELLREQGMDDVIVVVGGIIPEVDRQPLKDIGISEVFGPGTTTGSIVEFIQEKIKERAAA